MAAADVGERLRGWFERQRRDLPWRRTVDPYAIWVSEIMLQQTRVETVIPYYARFLEAFPTIAALATAPTDAVLKRWEGLGYYARARNLQRAARVVTERHGGVLPRSRDGLIALPGVGPYTAGAIASIAWGEAVAAVDGNVERVLSRLYAMERGSVWPHAEALVRQARDPSVHNQALMELGATVCTPRTPRCDACPLRPMCAAAATGEPARYPEKVRARLIPQREVVAALLWKQEHFLIVRRPQEGLLGGLWDLPWAEREGRESRTRTCARAIAVWAACEAEATREVARVEHTFTHFRMHLRVFTCETTADVPTGEIRRWITPSERDAVAFPRATLRVFETVFGRSSQ